MDDGSLHKPDVKIGDSVLFSKYAGSEVKIDGIEHLVMREDDLLGVIEH
jgi:chaperonin GroES